MDSSDARNARNVGKSAKTAIIANADALRRAAETNIGRVRDIASAPGSVVRRQYTQKMWQSFASHHLDLEQRKNQTPTASDLTTFVSVLPQILTTKHPSGAIPLKHVDVKTDELKHSLAFEHETFELISKDCKLLEDLYNYMLHSD